MRFYVHSREAEELGHSPWCAIRVCKGMSVREVLKQIARVADNSIVLDERGIPTCDLVTEPIRDVHTRFWELDKTIKCHKEVLKARKDGRAQRVNLPFAYAADLRAEHVPLFDGGKLYVDALWGS